MMIDNDCVKTYNLLNIYKISFNPQPAEDVYIHEYGLTSLPGKFSRLFVWYFNIRPVHIPYQMFVSLINTEMGFLLYSNIYQTQ